MKANEILIAVVAFVVLVSIGDGAAAESVGPGSANKEVKKDVEVATFAVPGLSKKLTKDIFKALAGDPGVLAGSPDFERKAISVAYDSGKTSTKKIQKIMKAITPGTRLEKVAPAGEKSWKRGCGTCPRRNNCANYNN